MQRLARRSTKQGKKSCPAQDASIVAIEVPDVHFYFQARRLGGINEDLCVRGFAFIETWIVRQGVNCVNEAHLFR